MKTWWKRRPRPGRGWKTARNLLWAVLAPLLFWFAIGCPAWTRDGALRRLEREMLLSPGETIYWDGDSGEALVVGERYAYVAGVQNKLLWRSARSLHGVERTGEPVLLAAGRSMGAQGDLVLFYLGGPEDAARAELTLVGEYEKRTYETLSQYGGLGGPRSALSQTASCPLARIYGTEPAYTFRLDGQGEEVCVFQAALRGEEYSQRQSDGVTRYFIGDLTCELAFYNQEGDLVQAEELVLFQEGKWVYDGRL